MPSPTTVTVTVPGTTWYLNGEDSLGLTYEKELKTTSGGVGITEHKHCLQAGGITFAMHTMRAKLTF